MYQTLNVKGNTKLFFSEVTDLDTGLLLEVWEKGMLWDRAIGYYWCPLNTIPFSKQVKSRIWGSDCYRGNPNERRLDFERFF